MNWTILDLAKIAASLKHPEKVIVREIATPLLINSLLPFNTHFAPEGSRFEIEVNGVVVDKYDVAGMSRATVTHKKRQLLKNKKLIAQNFELYFIIPSKHP